MHAVKVGWVGQTFAVAKSHESGGKKSRIRRSKEDRKAMVASFIRRYQNSNNGSFPSLNLTHKEVGGSFYTVREIVREIIQENRVLGPAKPAEGEQEVDHFHEHYPLGLISIECQGHVSSASIETHIVSSNHWSESEELESTLNGKVDGQQLQRLDNERYINGISVEGEYKEAYASKPLAHVTHDKLQTDIQVNQNLESTEDVLEISTPQVTLLATDVVVETFPIESARKIAQDIDGRSVEAGSSTVDSEQQETKRVEVKPELSETSYHGSLDEKYVEHLSDQLLDTLSSSTAENITSSTPGSNTPQFDAVTDELTLQTTNHDLVIAGMEPEPRLGPEKDQGESVSQAAAGATKTKTTEEGKNSTLNRAKLKSWEGSSRRTKEEESNPVLAAFKALVSAFVKFWTE